MGLKNIFEIESIIYGILSNCQELKDAINGGIYIRQRPINSDKEDVVVNTVALSQDSFPQIGTSNVNIHIPDAKVTIGGVSQNMIDIQRLSDTSSIVLSAIRNAIIPDIQISIEMQRTIQEADIYQHYSNIRINLTTH